MSRLRNGSCGKVCIIATCLPICTYQCVYSPRTHPGFREGNDQRSINLESSPNDVRILLSRAVEVIPLSVELWLALARLETPERAKAVLNKARKAVPTSHEIWIAAGRLLEQEATSHPEKSVDERNKELQVVDKTIEFGVRELRRHQVLLTRGQWLKEAERCESDGSPRTCEAIIKATVSIEIEEEDRLDTWVGDAESAEAKGMVGIARAMLAYALKVYPDRKSLWRKAADLEKPHGTRYVSSFVILKVLWLMSFLFMLCRKPWPSSQSFPNSTWFKARYTNRRTITLWHELRSLRDSKRVRRR